MWSPRSASPDDANVEGRRASSTFMPFNRTCDLGRANLRAGRQRARQRVAQKFVAAPATKPGPADWATQTNPRVAALRCGDTGVSWVGYALRALEAVSSVLAFLSALFSFKDLSATFLAVSFFGDLPAIMYSFVREPGRLRALDPTRILQARHAPLRDVGCPVHLSLIHI